MDELTAIELETLMLFSLGLEVKEIAKKRGVIPNTVNKTLANCKAKIGKKAGGKYIANNTVLCLVAREIGII